MSDLKSLEAAGCYISAGHLDHYDGRKHHRLGQVTVDGEVIYEIGGREYGDSLVMKGVADAFQHVEAPAVEAPVVNEPAAVSASDDLKDLLG